MRRRAGTATCVGSSLQACLVLPELVSVEADDASGVLAAVLEHLQALVDLRRGPAIVRENPEDAAVGDVEPAFERGNEINRRTFHWAGGETGTHLSRRPAPPLLPVLTGCDASTGLLPANVGDTRDERPMRVRLIWPSVARKRGRKTIQSHATRQDQQSARGEKDTARLSEGPQTAPWRAPPASGTTRGRPAQRRRGSASQLLGPLLSGVRGSSR